MANSQDEESRITAMWREVLIHGHHNRLGLLPSSPRCAICHIPFGGIGGTVVKLLGYRPSRKSPNLCNLCDEGLPQGGAEVDIAVLFADVRGSTALGERMGPSVFAALLNRFYKAATDSLLAHDAMIDKMVGDEVMALFIPSLCPQYRRAAVLAAEALVRAVGYGSQEGPWLPLGVAVHAGLAFVGKIGASGVNDFTALGDTVNTAARLQSEAAAGDIVLSEIVYRDCADQYPGLEQKTISVRGRDEQIMVRVLRPALQMAQQGSVSGT